MKTWMITILLGATVLHAHNVDRKLITDTADEEPSLKDFLEQVGYDNENTVTFPKLSWKHIPTLLKIARSKEVLHEFPSNPFSSQSQSQCREGIVALWLIEGIRKKEKGGYPSLNPLLHPRKKYKHQEDQDWETISTQYHQRAYCLYQKWWREHGSVSEAEAAKIDPLKGSPISWY